MAMITSQQIIKYYDLYRDREVTFSKDVSRTLNLDPRQIYVKCAGGQWPCILNSTSFQHAKIIIGATGGAYGYLSANGQKDAVVNCNIRFCFTQSDGQPLAFSVASKVAEIKPFANNLVLVTLDFSQRPPDDLIEILGTMLEANANAEARKDEVIAINEDNKRKLGLMKEETLISIQNIPRHCILRELSFGGAKVVLLGISQFLTEKETILYLDFEEPRETLQIRGKVSSTEMVQGRKDIVAATLEFIDAPLAYKLHINSFITAVRKVPAADSNAQAQIKAQKAAQAEAIRKRREEIAAQNAQKAAAEEAAQNAVNAQRQAQIQISQAQDAAQEAAQAVKSEAAAAQADNA